MLKDILNWLCGKEPDFKTELSIELGEEKVQSFSVPGGKFIVIDLGDLRKAVYSFGSLSNYEKKGIVQEIVKTLEPGTEVILGTKGDIDSFIESGFSIRNFESMPILKL